MMEQKKNIVDFVKAHKKTCFGISALFVLTVLGIFVFGVHLKEKQSNQLPEINTVVLKKQSLEKSISVTGTIESGQKKTLESEATDVKVLELHAGVGDVVKKGDVLCILDGTDAKEKLQNALNSKEIEQKKSELELQNVNNTFDNAQITRDINLERGNKAVADAYKAYEEAVAKRENTYTEWQAALGNLKTTQSNASEAKSSAARAEDRLYEQKKKVDEKQSAYDAAEQAVSDARQAQSVSGNQIDDAKIEALIQARDQAKEELNQAKDESGEKENKLTGKNNSKSEKENAYSDAKSSHSTKEAAYKEAVTNEETAKKAYEKEVQTAQDNMRTDEKTVKEQQIGVETAELNREAKDYSEENTNIRKYQSLINACTLVAPFDGTITSLGVEAGDTYKSGEIITIQNTQNLIVSAAVDQYSISDVAKGMKVRVKTEATGEEEMAGTLNFVSPVPKKNTNTEKTSAGNSSDTGNKNDYLVEAGFRERNDHLRLGMTAKTTIILDEVKDAFVVPYNCVEEENEKYYVTVLTNVANNAVNQDDKNSNRNKEKIVQPAQQKIEVEKGLETDYYVQIKAGTLKEGLQIVVPDYTEEVQTGEK